MEQPEPRSTRRTRTRRTDSNPRPPWLPGLTLLCLNFVGSVAIIVSECLRASSRGCVTGAHDFLMPWDVNLSQSFTYPKASFARRKAKLSQHTISFGRNLAFLPSLSVHIPSRDNISCDTVTDNRRDPSPSCRDHRASCGFNAHDAPWSTVSTGS